MNNRALTYILDFGSGTTFLGGIVSGQHILMVLGGLASLAAIINHTDQYIQRRKNKNNGTNNN